MRNVRLWLRRSLPLLGVFLFLLPLISSVIIYPKWDEFIVTFDAQRLLNGQVPYRDFFNFIPPGIFYYLAAVGALFGKLTLTISRYASLAVILINWLLLRTALERAGWSWKRALLFSLIYPICFYPFWPIASHHWLVQVACMGFLLVVVSESASERFQAALLGICAGAGSLVLQTDGLYIAAAGAVFLLLSLRGRRLFRAFLAWSLGLGTTLILGFGPLIALGAGRPMLRDLFLWPARNYSRTGNDNALPLLQDIPIRLNAIWAGVHPGGGLWRTLPLAVAGSVLYVLLLLVVAAMVFAAVWVLVRALKRKTFDSPLLATASLVTVLSLGLYLQGRPDWLRLAYLSAFLMGLWLVAAAQKGLAEMWRRRLAIFALVVLVFGGIYQSRWAWYHWPHPSELTDVDRPIRDSAVNRWLHLPGVLPPGATVAAFPEGGEVYLYGSPPAVGYTYFTPLSYGYNSLEDNRIVARQILKNRPRWILMTAQMESAYLDPASPVGRVIRRMYRRAGRVGDAVVYGLRRTGGSIKGN